ncbi:hypothetical protein L596_023421 [Steinernema carpocapsae]|uniref:Uncharacterized protein n=1 Tax=Steinernema carpocapsae TaxID=34508 RepID=A0A4U5MDM6_STECR|nr:hypothetical protein L596_023421 [Steinernema carpocapsae]
MGRRLLVGCVFDTAAARGGSGCYSRLACLAFRTSRVVAAFLRPPHCQPAANNQLEAAAVVDKIRRRSKSVATRQPARAQSSRAAAGLWRSPHTALGVLSLVGGVALSFLPPQRRNERRRKTTADCRQSSAPRVALDPLCDTLRAGLPQRGAYTYIHSLACSPLARSEGEVRGHIESSQASPKTAAVVSPLFPERINRPAAAVAATSLFASLLSSSAAGCWSFRPYRSPVPLLVNLHSSGDDGGQRS